MWYESLAFETPVDLQAAVKAAQRPGTKLICGGTDVVVQFHHPVPDVQRLLNIGQIPELKRLEFSCGQLIIGSAVCFAEFLQKAASIFSPLTEAVAQIASPSIRNLASFGGNIINASPSGDTLPVLYALDAELTLLSTNGERVIQIEDFITGPGATKCQPGEILIDIRMKLPEQYQYQYHKFGSRKALSCAKVNFLGMRLKQTDQIRLVYGAVAPTVLRLREAERMYEEGYLAEIPKTVNRLVKPIDDQRSTAAYRRYLCVTMTRRFLQKISE
jgi:CO/xanthine dehydrogenase FAD-binding subunit